MRMSIETPMALMTLLLTVKTFLEDKADHSETITSTLVAIAESVRPYDEELANIVTELTNKIHTWYVKDRDDMVGMCIQTQWNSAFIRLFRLCEGSDGWRLDI